MIKEIDNLLVLIPFFNEQKNMLKLLKLIESIEVESLFNVKLIFHNDNSNDNTLEIIENFKASSNLDIFIMNNFNKNLGHGGSLVKLSRQAFDNENLDYILTLDSDSSINQSDLFTFLSNKYHGVVFAKRSRFNDGLFRAMITLILEVIIFFTSGKLWRDVNCPLRLYSDSSFNKIWKHIPEETSIPNVFSTKEILKQKISVKRVNIRESNLENNDGVTWNGKSKFTKYKKILIFSFKAFKEIL